MIDLHQPKTHLALALISIGLSAPVQTHAALASDALLAFDPYVSGETVCYGNIGTYPDCSYGAFAPVSTGYFGLDTNANGVIEIQERVGLTPGPDGGILIGQTQNASGAHSGDPDGTENPGIDQPWDLSGTHMHLTTSPVNIINDDGAGNVALDFSGWRIVYGPDDGLIDLTYRGNYTEAYLTCISSCGYGDSFILDFSGGLPYGPWGDLGLYSLHLEGTIQQASTVPIPAAAWLFGSGLIGLIGLARRKKH